MRENVTLTCKDAKLVINLTLIYPNIEKVNKFKQRVIFHMT